MSISTVLIAIFILLAPALSIWGAGLLLDRACFRTPHRPLFALPSFLLGMILVFESGTLWPVLTLALQGGSWENPTVTLLSVITAITGSAAMVALSYLFVALAFELPARWLEGSFKVHGIIPFDALRVLLILVIVSMSVPLVVGLLKTELNPSRYGTFRVAH